MLSHTEKRICQNCKSEFLIDAQDFSFYEKIHVPPPTWCPECRMVRRMTWRNERSLYRRKCALTGKDVVSCFDPNSRCTVYDRDVWWSDRWDPVSYGLPYDFTKPFFRQYGALLETVPHPAVFNGRSADSDFCNHIGEMKDCYLAFASWMGERIQYSAKIMECKDSCDVLAVSYGELCYECVASEKMYRTRFCVNSENCTDSWFLLDCKGCTHCIGCVNLRNKSYCILNKPHDKDVYQRELERLKLGDYRSLQKFREEFKVLKSASIRKFARITNSENSSGDNLSHVSNCVSCFDMRGEVRNAKFCINGGMRMYDGYDGYGVGADSELIYESVDTGVNGMRFFFDIVVWTGSNIRYSYNCHGCHDCFACVGLRSKQYCILNKQYTKEEYEKLVPRIIEHMNAMPYADARGRVYRYGEFFPPELSPFCYNETIAQEYFPLTKEQALEKGYAWKDPEERSVKIQIPNDKLPDHIRDVPDDIAGQTIGCAHASPPAGGCNEQCTTAFKIIPQELAFYRKMNLPLPRLCPNCRHYQRLKQRNPLRLWHRTCMCQGTHAAPQNDADNLLPRDSASGPRESAVYTNTAAHFHGQNACPNEFETSYAPERPEIVYCESCYNSEVV